MTGVHDLIHHGPEAHSSKKMKPYKAPLLPQFGALLWRSWRATIQNPIIQWIKFILYMVRCLGEALYSYHAF